MSISFTGSGGAFTILGAIACATRNINGGRGTANPTPSSLWGASGPQIRCITTAINNIIAAHTTAQEKFYDGIRTIEASFVGAQDTVQTQLKNLAQSELINIVNADNPQADSTLATAMKEFIRQMKAGAQTVLRCTVGQSVTPGGSNVGNATVLCSTTGPSGVPREYAFAETLVATCTGDGAGNGSGGTLGSEPLTIVAPAAITNTLSQLWPAGSGSVNTINVVDPNIDAQRNLLTNSNFEQFNTSANVPDNWSGLVGSPGTSIKKDTSVKYGANAAASLQFVGDGAELTSVTQLFGAAAGSGTTADVAPASVYGFNLWVYTATHPAAGVLKIDLVDGSNNVINDDSGTPNTITRDLTTLSDATWTNVAGFFRTPTNLPSTVKIRIRLSTAMTAARTLNMDFGAMAQATQLYTAGPFVCAFRASTDLVFNDTWNIAVTNDRQGIFQTWFEEVFSMSTMQLILPSLNGGNSINDNLVA